MSDNPVVYWTKFFGAIVELAVMLVFLKLLLVLEKCAEKYTEYA